MSAHLYCWSSDLELAPSEPGFHDRVRALYDVPKPPASPGLAAFVAALLSRYPDATETDDTVWADGPLINNIRGHFINITLRWPLYAKAAPFIVETAHKHGLHCYDPQKDAFYAA